MKELTLKQIQERELKLLIEIRNFCDKNGIRYFLTGGTLIGAIRHKGFIPWDDDIDIVMPRPDYNKFLDLYKKEKTDNILYSIETNKKYPIMFAKLCDNNTIIYQEGIDFKVEMSVFVDIFPVDGMGDSEDEAKNLLKKIKPYILLHNLTFFKRFDKASKWYKTPIKLFIYMFLKAKGYRYIAKKIDKISKTYDFEKTKYVGNFNDSWQENRIMPRWIYEKKIEVSFEGETFNAPIGYDYYLTKFYGDYMTPPPKDEQFITHGFKAYLK